MDAEASATPQASAEAQASGFKQTVMVDLILCALAMLGATLYLSPKPDARGR